MKVPNFKSKDGAILYKDTVGKQISPRVGAILLDAVAQTGIPDSAQVLDVACGPGTIALRLAADRNDLSLVGVDSSQAMIAQCKQTAVERKLLNTEFVEMDAGQLDFDENQFHLVTCNLAFPFFAQPEESLRQVRRILKPGGQVFMTAPGEHTWQEFFEVATSTLGDAVKFARPFLAKFQQAGRLPGAMESVGFTAVQVSRHKIPFNFQNGQAVLKFFNELFSLLSYAPPELQVELASELDRRYPDGFQMHYEAVLVQAQR